MDREQAIRAAVAMVAAGEPHIAVRVYPSGEHTICPPDVQPPRTSWVADVWFLWTRNAVRIETREGWEEIAI
jgi:hypothetical protein